MNIFHRSICLTSKSKFENLPAEVHNFSHATIFVRSYSQRCLIASQATTHTVTPIGTSGATKKVEVNLIFQAASVRHAEEMKSRSFETNPTSDKVDCVRLKLISDDGVFELR